MVSGWRDTGLSLQAQQRRWGSVFDTDLSDDPLGTESETAHARQCRCLRIPLGSDGRSLAFLASQDPFMPQVVLSSQIGPSR